MESSAAYQLPEVDALPDGFVESSAETTAPITLSNEKEKPLYDYKDSLMELDSLKDLSIGATVESFFPAVGKVKMAPKVRTFPVPLSDIDGYEASGESVGVSDDGIGPESVAYDSYCVRGLEAEITYVKKSQLAENYQNKKELPEVKCKSSKRNFKTEQEFLEFTLKYEQVLEERDAAIAVRDKLELLCRELQRQNKLLMDEFKRVSEEGQSLRLDLSTKFEDAIKGVSYKLEEQKEESLSQLKENEMLRDKLKQLAEHYTVCQQQYAQELNQKTLELKLTELKIQQNKEKLSHEQAQMKVYAEKVSQLLETEKGLRLQLSNDGEKFEHFQMGKWSKDLKEDNAFLKIKCERSDFTLIELVEDRERMKMQLEKTTKQKDRLESLCRSLQAERKWNSDSSG